MPTPKFDKRLLGTWKSDRRRTIREIKWGPKATASSKRKFAALFGRLILRYTRTKLYSGFEGEPLEAESYKILATDSVSAVIHTHVNWLDEDRIRYMRFEGDDSYWIIIDGCGIREWFRRIPPASKVLTKKK